MPSELLVTQSNAQAQTRRRRGGTESALARPARAGVGGGQRDARAGGQDKLAQRLLEALRYFLLPEAATEPPCRISFVGDTS